MSIFNGANDPSIPVGYNRAYFTPGHYRVKIESLKAKDAKDTFKGKPVFIAELIVVASDNGTPPGAVYGWVQSITGETARAAFASLKEFFAAIYNDPTLKEIGGDFEKHLDMACSEANPYHGIQLDLVCFVRKTKAGNDFTVHNWKPLGTFDQELGVGAA